MNPWITQALAAEHRSDLLRAAERRSRSVTRVANGQTRVHSFDTRLGWLLIRLGSRLVVLPDSRHLMRESQRMA